MMYDMTSLALDLSSELEHALEVFSSVARKDRGGEDDPQALPYPLPTIGAQQIGEMLTMLDIEASEEEQDALFKYLDEDGDGEVSFDEFLPWYNAAAQAAKEMATNFQAILIGRRTVDTFDQTPVDEDVLKRAVQCAIAAPNRSGSEPWRFVSVGPETVKKLGDLQTDTLLKMEEKRDGVTFTKSQWTDIPGWCVVTTKVTPQDPVVELEDFQSTSCAVQNLMVRLLKC
jgi:hypothetical protein